MYNFLIYSTLHLSKKKIKINKLGFIDAVDTQTILVDSFVLDSMNFTEPPLLFRNVSFVEIGSMVLNENTIESKNAGIIHFQSSVFRFLKLFQCTKNTGLLGPCFTANVNDVVPKQSLNATLEKDTWLKGTFSNNIAKVDGGAFVLVLPQNPILSNYYQKGFSANYKSLISIADLVIKDNMVGSEPRNFFTGNSWDISLDYSLHANNIKATKNISDKGLLFFDNIQTAKTVFQNLTLRVFDQFGRKPIPSNPLRDRPQFGKAWLFSSDLNISIFVGNASAIAANASNSPPPNANKLRLRALQAPGGKDPSAVNPSAGSSTNSAAAAAGSISPNKSNPPPLTHDIIESLKASTVIAVQKKVNVSGSCYNRWRGGSSLKLPSSAANNIDGSISLYDQPTINSPEGTWFLIVELGLPGFSVLNRTLANNIVPLKENSFFVLPLNFQDGVCNCAAGTYLEASDCKKCDDSCLSCSSGGAKGCLLCSGGSAAIGGVCSCPDGDVLTREGCLSNT
jgi:hypothetical protein